MTADPPAFGLDDEDEDEELLLNSEWRFLKMLGRGLWPGVVGRWVPALPGVRGELVLGGQEGLFRIAGTVSWADCDAFEGFDGGRT